jgi:hypothetical protein
MDEALKLLSTVGIDVDDLKRRIASGDWVYVEGDATCVLKIVELTRHSAIILLIEDEFMVCLARKTQVLRELTGLGEEILKSVVEMRTRRTPAGCAVHALTASDLERGAEEIANRLVESARAALKCAETCNRGVDSESPAYIT